MGKRVTGRRGQRLRKQEELPRINVDALALWRAQREGDPVAARAWARYKARIAELMSAWAFERFGRPLDDCDFGQKQELRTEACELAITEL